MADKEHQEMILQYKPPVRVLAEREAMAVQMGRKNDQKRASIDERIDEVKAAQLDEQFNKMVSQMSAGERVEMEIGGHAMVITATETGVKATVDGQETSPQEAQRILQENYEEALRQMQREEAQRREQEKEKKMKIEQAVAARRAARESAREANEQDQGR